MKTVKTIISIVILSGSLVLTGFQKDKSNMVPQETRELIKNISWINNACVRIAGSKQIWFDPYQITHRDVADIIFVTHEHSDHFSLNDIQKITGENTIIVGPQCVTRSLDNNARTVKAGDVINIKGIRVQVVPSYTIHIDAHAKAKGYVGYIVTMDNVRYYHPGDSDFIPEMKQIKTDIAFLPVCGTYMMSAEDAAKVAEAMKPKVVIPFHYGSVFGSKADAEEFKDLYSGVTVILDPE